MACRQSYRNQTTKETTFVAYICLHHPHRLLFRTRSLRKRSEQGIFPKSFLVIREQGVEKGQKSGLTNSKGQNILSNRFLDSLKDKVSNLNFMPSDLLVLNRFGNVNVGERTNNFGELLGLFLALSLVEHHGIRDARIYIDSTLVLDHWSRGNIKTKDPSTKILGKATTKLRKKLERRQGLTVSFISGDDNPSDLGFHKSKKPKAVVPPIQPKP